MAPHGGASLRMLRHNPPMVPEQDAEQFVPFITLPNWVKAATLCGFNIEPVFAELGVETDLIHVEEATISQPLLAQMMIACVERSSGRHFPFVLGETFAFEYLPDLGTFLAASPTLREAARVFGWVRDLVNPMIDIRMEDDGEIARLILRGNRAVLGRYFVETLFAAIAKFGRALAGDADPFLRMCFRHSWPSYGAEYAPYFRTEIAFSQPLDAIEVRRAMLDAPRTAGFPALHRQAMQRVEQRLLRLPPPRSRLAAAIEAKFEEDPRLLGAGIADVAGQLGLQARTLQRRLRDAGSAYADLQARVRYRLALRALDDRRLTLEAVSEQLGFSDRRSFTRAFTRWAGMTPSQYRGRDSA